MTARLAKARVTMLFVARVCLTIHLLLLLLPFVSVQGKPQQTKPGCRYEGKRYQEGAPVATSEPCLQCRCIEGSLRCRLRICPRLPQKVPAGCRARPPADNVCCSKLVCGTNEDDNENILQRSNSGIAHSRIEEGCLYEGVRYGPGSAMMGSRRCEYCYCISGARRCIRPKCLLPLPGCAPLYAPHSCCPVAYNCTRHSAFSTTHAATMGNGCRTGERIYQEGEMVRDIAQKASCDNCFCAMGEIRCVPLSCAPPLQGCKPIVREGQCCPSTYNCSGTIEVKATQNYASYAFISKDYAKFRKETNFYPAIHDAALGAIVEGRGHRVVNEALESVGASNPLEISSEKFAMATESMPTLETETMNNEILSETTDYPKHTTRDQEQLTASITETLPSTDTSNFDQSTITTRDSIDEATFFPSTTLYLREVSTTLEEDTWMETSTLASTLLSTATMRAGSTGDDTYTSADENTTITTTAAATASITAVTTTTTTTTTTTNSNSTIREVPESSSIIAAAASTTKQKENCVRHGPGGERESIFFEKVHLDTTLSRNLNASTVKTPSTTTTLSSTIFVSSNPSYATTKRIPQSSSTKELEKTSQAAQKKIDTVLKDKLKIHRPIAVQKPSSGLSTSVIVPDDMLVMNVTVKTNVAVEHVHGVTINPIEKTDIVEAILNITNRNKGDDYELDYSQPTLPPSLPGVRIIPFVAADALVKDKDESGVVSGISGAVTGYPPRVGVAVPPPLPPELSRTDAANFYDIVTQENRFSPPKKTEGGFMPRDPMYFDPLFHSSSINLEIGTGVTVAPEVHSVPNLHRKTDGLVHDCLYEGREYSHGQVVPSRAHCMMCICYYGEVVCSDRKCPPLKIGCKRISDPNDQCCSKIICVDGHESPTVVLSGETVGSLLKYEPTVSPDPFRDVIKTEPAPDLPSLIGAMMPYLVEHSITTPVVMNRNPSVTLDFDDYIGSTSHNGSNPHHLQPSSASSSLQYQPDLNIVREYNASSSNIADEISLTNPPDLDPDPIVITEQIPPGKPDASSIFSGVLDLFFNEPSPSTTITSITTEFAADTITKVPLTASESPATIVSENATSKSTIGQRENLTMTTTTTATVTTTTTTSTVEKDAGINSGLLKLAGCNIYGRMYRVGMIISELSESCSECRCTEHGVECKNLGC